MRVEVLGCSGGIGGVARTTSLRVDADILIDCGTGVGSLALDDLLDVDHVFLTHSHLDHIALLPLLVDTVCELRGRPLKVYALEETLRILRAHVFNWLVWPDFTAIPDRLHPMLLMQPVRVGERVQLGNRCVQVLPALHTVPAVGYCLDSGHGQLAFTGDTTVCDELLAAINELDRLRYLLIETAFPNRYQDLAHAARHLCPSSLQAVLACLQAATPEVYVTHFKSGHAEQTEREVLAQSGRLHPGVLQNGQVFEF